MKRSAPLDPTDGFVHRHVGPRDEEIRQMCAELGFGSLDELVDTVVPDPIRSERPLDLPPPRAESEVLAELREIAGSNRVVRSFVGLGYHDTLTPPVIQRNILENPGWYTQYTPYQAEIAQGRLEMLLNFQTVVSDLTALPIANASLLDEATAAAEAMAMCHGTQRHRPARDGFFVTADCHPQTIEVVSTRAEAVGIDVTVGDPAEADLEDGGYFALLLQTPATDGRLHDPRSLVERAKSAGLQVIVATDLLASVLLVPPGEAGADVAVGSAQRFGVPLGFGGPHAAFIAAGESYARRMPGRIVGLSKDSAGHPAYRLALQTREQHIRREKATSNICTAQVLLAVMAAAYAVYHGPEGLRRIARRVHAAARLVHRGLGRLGCDTGHDAFFDTLRVGPPRGAESLLAAAREAGINLRDHGDGSVGIALDEAVTRGELQALLDVFAGEAGEEGSGEPRLSVSELEAELAAESGEQEGAGLAPAIPRELVRTSGFLLHDVFARYRSEHEMLRYLKRLENRDLSLVHSMIPLGSCTMKLNATTEMMPVTWSGFARIHPFAPADQTPGYRRLFADLEAWLAEITGLPAVSLQPNAGSQGELAGLLVVRAYHRSRDEGHRDVCLIPTSAHGTNPASAVMAGLRVVAVACDASGNVDLEDLDAKVEAHADRLAALMITYPSTHGVFERGVRRICERVHEAGGQVYLDGANLNAQVGLARPGDYGADVCHLNLHKTFCIPHGGGGPGMGPIVAAEHLAPFLPGHPLASEVGGGEAIGPIAAAPWGSSGILPISWAYIALMGGSGLTRASRVAILAANYMAHRLHGHYPVLYTGESGLVAHELILDLRPFKEIGVSVDDVAKRLIDYGFHAPTMSWPVAGTMMVEPTESESKDELDRFCDAMIAIREEIRDLEEGRADADDNVLVNAPHTAAALAGEWTHPYSRRQAAFPAPWMHDGVHEGKFWPAVGRVDNAWGDRNLVCSCPSVEAFASEGGEAPERESEPERELTPTSG